MNLPGCEDDGFREMECKNLSEVRGVAARAHAHPCLCSGPSFSFRISGGVRRICGYKVARLQRPDEIEAGRTYRPGRRNPVDTGAFLKKIKTRLRRVEVLHSSVVF